MKQMSQSLSCFGILNSMVHNNYIRGIAAIFFAIFILSTASPAEATRSYGRYGYSSGLEKKINALDDDIVKTISLPILFGITLSNITPNFGDPRDGGARSHEGLDMLAPLGTPIVSPTDAVVLNTGGGAGSGNFVSTANPGGERYVYMHLDTIADIKSGDVLKAGDMIGTVGDTGNAKGGPPHLHFEIREDGKALDPYQRIKKEFTLEDKMKFINSGFTALDDEKDLAEFLVTKYMRDFQSAVNNGFELPNVIDTVLKKKGITSTASLQKQLDTIIASIPKVVTKELKLVSQGGEVSLIQFFLINENNGPVAVALGRAGATGYYGPTTVTAMSEYQKSNKIPVTGIYDAKTREMMIK